MSRIKEYLKKKIDEEILLYYKNPSNYPKEIYEKLLIRWGDDSVFSEEHRFILLNILIPNLHEKKILDMASGCGSFVIQGLRHGYDTYGIEPEEWKQEIVDLKFSENDYPKEWRARIKKDVGEKLSFPNDHFDVFDSWQTIEHVGNERDCIFELYRVLKKGGMGILRGPDYICFFEGHYKLFWFPLLEDSKFAKFYLKLRNRPLGGLKTFHAVNPFKTRKYAKEAGFKVIDIKRKQIYDAAKRRFPPFSSPICAPILWGIYLMWDTWRGIRYFGCGEATISFLLVKE